MANNLDALENDLWTAADTVGREVVGFIPSCTINANENERGAIGQKVKAAFSEEVEATDIVPQMNPPAKVDRTTNAKEIYISKARKISLSYNGEEQRNLNTSVGFRSDFGDKMLQAMRTLTNEIEADLAAEAYKNASRAIGTAGTTPFGSNFDELAELDRILTDNGAPEDGALQRTLVMNTAAGVKLKNQAQLQSVDSAGNDSLLRQGMLLDLQGFAIRRSAGISTHTKGTGTGYLVNKSGGHAVKDDAITVDTGSGTILAGDVVTFAGDSNKYVVNTALSGSSLSIGTPGLREAAADDAALTVGNNYTPNVAFHRSALELVIRPYTAPEQGDQSIADMVVRDPHSGLIFEMRVYPGYRMVNVEISTCWGFKAWKPDFIATLMG